MLRRELVLAGAFGLAAAAVQPRAMARATTPRYRRLRKGDVVAVVAPASVTYEKIELDYAGDVLRALGLEPRFGANVAKRFGYLAGEDGARAADINAAFADPAVAAVFALRGGWGSGRLLPLLDYAAIALLLALNARSGLVGVHGPNLLSDWNPFVVEVLRELLFEGKRVEYRPHRPETDSLATLEGRIQTLVPGVAEGELVGGNLTVFSSLVGTPYLPDMRGKLLFLEDVHEAVYRIDRAMTQLRLAGILDQVSGVVFGEFKDIPPENGYGEFTLGEVLEQHCRAAGKPAFLGAAFGHVPENSAIPVGVRARMDAVAGVVSLLEPVVS
jgi:muramoyltetrapeptide carboxypeptidase